MALVKQCETCGKEMSVKPSRYERTKYCSKECARQGWAGKSRSPGTEFKKGQKPWCYKGWRSDKHGYILIYAPEHPRARTRRAVYEHILVWEQHHDRPLPEDWLIHHINGIKDDNRIENLVAMPKRKHHPALDPGYIKARLREVETEMAEWRRKYEELKTKYDDLLQARRNSR